MFISRNQSTRCPNEKLNKDCSDDQLLRYKDVFDGFVFYNPIEDHTMVYGFPEWFEDDDYVSTYKEQLERMGRKPESIEKIKKKNLKEGILEEPYAAMWLKKRTIYKWLR